MPAKPIPQSPLMNKVVPRTYGMGPMQLERYYDQATRSILTGLDGEGVRVADMTDEAFADAIMKADIATTTTGAFNALYGSDTWTQVLQNQNLLGALRKDGWPRSGFRVVSAAAVSSALGIAQGGSIPTAVVPTYIEIPVTIKELAERTSFTQVFASIERKDDCVTWDENLRVFQRNWMAAWDTDLCADYNAADPATLTNFDGIDRLTMTTALRTTLGGNANYEDYLMYDRSANAFWDPYANGAAAARTLSLSLINTLLANQAPYWNLDAKGNKGAFYITGFDTWTRWSELMQSAQRFSEADVKFGAEGLEVVSGVKGGLKALSYDGIPIVMDSNIQKDTLSRIYLLNNDFTALRMAIPVEAISSSDPFIIGFLKQVALHAAGELVCTTPKTEGQLRNIK